MRFGTLFPDAAGASGLTVCASWASSVLAILYTTSEKSSSSSSSSSSLSFLRRDDDEQLEMILSPIHAESQFSWEFMMMRWLGNVTTEYQIQPRPTGPWTNMLSSQDTECQNSIARDVPLIESGDPTKKSIDWPPPPRACASERSKSLSWSIEINRERDY